MKVFEAYKLKNMTLKNRIVMPPMCLYSTDNSGKAQDFHLVNYMDRAIGGVGLIIVEATAVAPNGRISDRDLGLWEDSQIEGLARVVKGCQAQGSKVAVQLAHAGRKCEVSSEKIVAPSSIRFNEQYQVPVELCKKGIKEIVKSFGDAAERAHKAGFDAIEIHGAHGYLIHEFLSPITNKRSDEYGGVRENRVRFLKEVLEEVKRVWPEDKPVILRISADDYNEEGINTAEMVEIVNLIKCNVDIIHVSSGGLIPVPIDVYPGYQVKHCEEIREKCGVPTIAVGLITEADQVEELLKNERADLVALGRELERNPYWVLHTAKKHGVEIEFPAQYKRAFGVR